MKKIFIIMMCGLFLFSACTSTTVIKASSPHAKIYADGKFLGEGNVVYSDKKIVGSKTLVEIKGDGFKDKMVTISRSESINAGALISGILLAPTVVGLLFFLWVTDYSNHYGFELEKDTQTAKK